MQFHSEELTKGVEEVGDKFGTSVRHDMSWYSMFQEDMLEEELGQLRRVNHVIHRDEKGLFGESIHNDEDGSVSIGGRELFNEVHGD